MTDGWITLIDEEDLPLIAPFSWRHTTNRWGNTYAEAHPKQSDYPYPTQKMHRVIIGAPVGVQVDHRDGVGLNNQKFNLRLATNSNNQMNKRMRVDNRSGFKGVSWHAGKWVAEIRIDGRKIHLGRFADPVQAALSYDRAADRLFGEFARTNRLLGLV